MPVHKQWNELWEGYCTTERRATVRKRTEKRSKHKDEELTVMLAKQKRHFSPRKVKGIHTPSTCMVNINFHRKTQFLFRYAGLDNGLWFIVSYDSANKQEHYKKPLH